MATTQTLERVRKIQTIMATAYGGMGAWCLLHPTSVLNLCLTPPYAIINRTTTLLTRCFGAQAMTCGLLLYASDMTERSFAAFGFAMIPYLGFNAWFGIGPGRGVFTEWLWLDFIGNLVYFGGSLGAARLLREDARKRK